MPATISGHLTAQDVALLEGEFADSAAYLKRTLPNIIKLAYKGLEKHDGLLKLSVVELAKLDALGGLNRYLLEPLSTYQARSRIIYSGGSRNHNIQGLVALQRLCSREQFCPRGSILPQEHCFDDKCSNDGRTGCRLSMCMIDGGHNVGLSNMLESLSLNAAVVMRL